MKKGSDDYIAFDANVRTHKATEYLSINGMLLGRSHLFTVDGKSVTLHLPEAHQDEGPNPAIFRYRYHTSDPDNPAKSGYHIYRVMIEVEIPAQLFADAQVFNRHANARDIVSASDQKKYQHIIDENELLLSTAFDKWQRVARWVSRKALICGQSRQDQPHTVRIVRRSDSHSVWIGTISLMAQGGDDLTLQDWQFIQMALDAGVEPPIWFDYLSEGCHRHEVGDHPGALLSFAISCETIMRAILWAKAGKPTNPLAAQLIDRANAQTIIGHWRELLEITKSEVKTWKLSALHEMFDARNKLIHEGENVSLDHAKLVGYQNAVREFLDRADDVVRAGAGLTD